MPLGTLDLGNLMIKGLFQRDARLVAGSLADQGVVSLGGFLTQVILARNLAPREYGIFALIFGTLILLNISHLGLVTYPLSIQGASANSESLSRLTSSSLVLTVLLAPPFLCVIAPVCWYLKQPTLIPWVALALLAWQLQETLRRSLMVHLQHHSAIGGDVISYLGQAAILWYLAARAHLTLPAVFATIAATSLLAAVIQAWQIGVTSPRFRGLWKTLSVHWQMGKWAICALVTDNGTILVVPWTLAVLHGPEQAASLQAAMNVIGITTPVNLGIYNLIVPACARSETTGTALARWKIAKGFAKWGLLALAPCYAVLLLWPRSILLVFYGSSSPYLNLAVSCRILCLAYFCGYFFGVMNAFFNGVERPWLVVKSEIVGVLALLLVLPLIWYGGILGASCGILMVFLFRLAGDGFFLRQFLRQVFVPEAQSVPVHLNGTACSPGD